VWLHQFLHRPLGVLALSLCACSSDAVAGFQDCSGPLPHTVNIPAVSVPAGLPVGQPIPGASALFSVTLTCVNNTPRANSRWYLTENAGLSFTLVPGFADVYTVSGLPAGLGLRMRHRNGNVLVPINYHGRTSTFEIETANPGTNLLAGSFELVRTAPNVSAANGVVRLFGHVDNQVWANLGQGTSQITFSFSIRPTAVATCRVTRPDITVNLPTVGASALANFGTTAGSTGFAVNLDCESNARPQLHLTDASKVNNDTTTLSTSAASTASGVGVQVLYASVPLRFGPAPHISVAGAVAIDNRTDLGLRSGNVVIPFQARYIRTEAAIRPGSVQALALFTLSYP